MLSHVDTLTSLLKAGAIIKASLHGNVFTVSVDGSVGQGATIAEALEDATTTTALEAA